MCVGSITSADQINTILAAGRADLVALARPHLVDPGFTMRAAADYGVTDVPCPVQYQYGRDALMRSAGRERLDLLELRRRARPDRHGATADTGHAGTGLPDPGQPSARHAGPGQACPDDTDSRPCSS